MPDFTFFISFYSKIKPFDVWNFYSIKLIFTLFFPNSLFFAFISCWYCSIYFTECKNLFYLLFINYIIYSRLVIKPLILVIHYIFRSLFKVVSMGKCMCMCMQSLLLILFIYLRAIENIMGKNNENTQNNTSKFRVWLQCQQGKSKTNIIFKETYDKIYDM